MSGGAEEVARAREHVAARRWHEAVSCFEKARALLEADLAQASAAGGAGTKAAAAAYRGQLAALHPDLAAVMKRLSDSHYAALGLPSDSGRAEVKKAYRRLALAYHPDKNRHTTDLFRLIHDAYETLKDKHTPKRREGGSSFRDPYDQPDSARGAVPPGARASAAAYGGFSAGAAAGAAAPRPAAAAPKARAPPAASQQPPEQVRSATRRC
jgi:hypothetical protein